MPAAHLGNRSATLAFSSTPPILISGANSDIYLHFRVYDSLTNTTINFPTFIISVYNGTDPNARPLLQDAFMGENGPLTLKIHPQEGNVQVQGNILSPFFNVWTADPGGTITVKGPLFLHPGLYHIHAVLIGIDHPGALLGDFVPFDVYLRVAKE